MKSQNTSLKEMDQKEIERIRDVKEFNPNSLSKVKQEADKFQFKTDLNDFKDYYNEDSAHVYNHMDSQSHDDNNSPSMYIKNAH